VTRVVLAGPDPAELGAALEAQGLDVTRVRGVLTAAALDEVGVADADLFVLTDLDEATAIPIVKDRNQAIRVVVYSHDPLPGFVSGQADLAMDPELFGVDLVADELS
jgi:hypothetical protein